MISFLPTKPLLLLLNISVLIGLSSFPFKLLAAGLMPFVMGNAVTASSIHEASNQVESVLKKNGFQVVGSYTPADNKNVIVVTNSHLQKLATQSNNGGFGAMERIAVVANKGSFEVSYTNPRYMWNVYRMQGDIAPVENAMEKALGYKSTFGAERGLSASDLRNYQYKMMIPYFDDEDELAVYSSHKAAVAAVEAGLKANRAQSHKVYRIDIPGTEMSVFGVALSHGEAADKFISRKIDGQSASHAAHFPYEILINGKQVLALNGKFRIAINWPSLSMMGTGSFMSISGAPDHIKEALEAVANNQPLEKDSDSLI